MAPKYKIHAKMILEEFELINKELKEIGYKDRFKKVLNERVTREDKAKVERTAKQNKTDFLQKYKRK